MSQAQAMQDAVEAERRRREIQYATTVLEEVVRDDERERRKALILKKAEAVAAEQGRYPWWRGGWLRRAGADAVINELTEGGWL